MGVHATPGHQHGPLPVACLWGGGAALPAFLRSTPARPAAPLHMQASHTARSWRNTLALLARDGVAAYAPDWPGHGDSAKPAPGAGFDYSEGAYIKALGDLVGTLAIKKPIALVVQVRSVR